MMGWPWVRCPPWGSFMPITLSPGLSAAKYTAWLACEPEWGCTLTCSAPNSSLARSMASVSTTSTYSQPP